MEASSTPCRRSPSRAPSRRRDDDGLVESTGDDGHPEAPTAEVAFEHGHEPPSFVEQVSQAIPLGPQVTDVLLIRDGVERDTADDLQSVPFEAASLGRIVGHEPHGGDPQVNEYLGPDTVLAAVYREAQLDVGVDRVEPAVLQLVGLELVGYTDSPALVTAQVHHDSEPLVGDVAQGALELGPAVAAA